MFLYFLAYSSISEGWSFRNQVLMSFVIVLYLVQWSHNEGHKKDILLVFFPSHKQNIHLLNDRFFSFNKHEMGSVNTLDYQIIVIYYLGLSIGPSCLIPLWCFPHACRPCCRSYSARIPKVTLSLQSMAWFIFELQKWATGKNAAFVPWSKLASIFPVRKHRCYKSKTASQCFSWPGMWWGATFVVNTSCSGLNLVEPSFLAEAYGVLC